MKQVRHIRTSKYGRRFVAGRGGARSWITFICREAGVSKPPLEFRRADGTIHEWLVRERPRSRFEKGTFVIYLPSNYHLTTTNNKKAFILHEALHIKYQDNKHSPYFQNDFKNIGIKMRIPEFILMEYKRVIVE